MPLSRFKMGSMNSSGHVDGVNSKTQKMRIPGPFVNAKPKKNHHRVALIDLHPERVYPESTFYKAASKSNKDMTADDYVMKTIDGVLGDETQKIIDEGIPPGSPRRNTILKLQ